VREIEKGEKGGKGRRRAVSRGDIRKREMGHINCERVRVRDVIPCNCLL
jgi:hypothetical protein